jgi:hypothetical protein
MKPNLGKKMEQKHEQVNAIDREMERLAEMIDVG